MYYGPDIMEKAGIVFNGMTEEQSALLLSIPLSFFNALGTLLSIFFIDRMGRRYLILRSLPLITLTWLIVATGMAFTGENQSSQNQTIGGIIACVGIYLFIFIFAFGIGTTFEAV